MTDTPTFAEMIETLAAAPIEAAVIADLDYGSDERHELANSLAGQILNWPEARRALDYRFDVGFGSRDCNDVVVWTADRVIFVHEYDGSTTLRWVSRNPAVPAEGWEDDL